MYCVLTTIRLLRIFIYKPYSNTLYKTVMRFVLRKQSPGAAVHSKMLAGPFFAPTPYNK
jgi:hypothetical protein